MRINIKKILMISAVMTIMSAAVSCEYRFNLDKFEQPPLLFLECIAGSNDSTVVQLLAAMPINKDKGAYNTENAKLEMTLNGKPISVKKRHTSSFYKSLYWVADVKYNPGDKVTMMAELDGIAPVSSETVIPEVMPVSKVRIYGEKEDMSIRAQVDFKSSPCRYYGMRIYQTIHYSAPDFAFVRDVESQMCTVNKNVNYVNETFDKCFIFWDADDYDSKSIDIKLTRPSFLNAEYNDVRYRVEMYSLTEELYKYLVSLYVNENGWNTGSDFIYKSMFAYSNINGGVGVLGGIRKMESGNIVNGQIAEFK